MLSLKDELLNPVPKLKPPCLYPFAALTNNVKSSKLFVNDIFPPFISFAGLNDSLFESR